MSKKELDIEISVGNDFYFYVKEILSNVVDDQYDLHTKSMSKLLFYSFNTFRQKQRLALLKIRHSIIANDDFALNVVQSHNWQYFIETLLHISNNETNLDDYNLKNNEDFDQYLIIEKTLDKLKYCRNFNEDVFDDVSYFFDKKIQELPDDFVKKMEDDLSNAIYYTKKLKEVDSHIEVLKIFNRFFFKTGRFPGNHDNLMIVPAGVKPSFLKTRDEISPFEINEKFQSGPSYGLAAIQFLAAKNIYFGSDKTIFQNVMSEFFHDLSLQALSIDDDSVKIEFDAIITLSKNLKFLIRDDTRNYLNIIDFQQQKFDEIKDKNQLIEEEVVNNIINDVQIDYPQDNQYLTFPNTAS